MAETFLFVYGTLKAGLSNHFRMGGSRLVGPATTLPLYRMYNLGWHPGIVHVGQGVSIEGEIYAVPPDTLAALDEFEGVPHAFLRLPIALQHVTDEVHAYFFNGEVPPEATTGTVWPFPR